MGTKAGWSGRVYEDFEVGDVYDHPLGRTVIPADNVWFTLLSQNTNPITSIRPTRPRRSLASRSWTRRLPWRS